MKSNLTLVTSLFDLKRGDLNSGFSRAFDHYIECFKRLLQTDLPMIIFCDEDVEEIVWEIRTTENTKIVRKTKDDLRAFPFYDKVTEIRNDPEWRGRSGWLEDSPQANLELYNPLVMSKQFLLNDAAIMNFFDTKYFLWIDAGIANTIGDPVEYFNIDVSRKLTKQMNKMLYLCFPYDGQVEVHGFEKKKFNEYAGEETTRVARGGMFGGTAYAIAEANNIYYQLLSNTLNDGYMGTEESIFTLITYKYPDICNIYPIDSNGLIIKALQEIKVNVQHTDAERLAVYTLTFNIPKQFEYWVKSFKEAYPKEYEDAARYVINNSTDPLVDEEYQRLFDEYDFQEFKFENNIGICGGRQFAAEHFDDSDHEYMVFFEDDMLLHTKPSTCKSGFTTYHQKLFDKCIDIVENEGLDYLKLCFSEFYGDNHENWSWYNLPQDKKKEYFPAKTDGTNPRSTLIKRTGTHRGLPYAVGEYHYCNWPILFTKEGNRKVFLETKFAHKYEQTWMSFVMQQVRAGRINPGCLLASTINHSRRWHYDGKIRKENEHN